MCVGTLQGYVCAGGDCNNLVLNVVDSITGKNVTFVSEDPKPDIAEIQVCSSI
jgi:hypothetical protein